MPTGFDRLLDVGSLSKAVQSKVEKAVESASKDMLKLLGRKVNTGGGGYSEGDGISPYDYMNKGKHISDRAISKWSSTTMRAGNVVQTEFSNSSSYAEFLYSKRRSVGHENGFRSAYPHEEDALILNKSTKRLERTGKKRPDQLTFAKWMGFRRYMKKKLETEIKKEFKL